MEARREYGASVEGEVLSPADPTSDPGRLDGTFGHELALL